MGEKEENTGKLQFITIAYGIAAILVIFGHSHPLNIDYPQWMHGIINFIYKFHMPLFFFIAGVLIAYTQGCRQGIVLWWMRKVRKLIVPYLVLTLAAYVPKVLLGSYMNDDMAVSASGIVRIILIPREGVWGHFWFIPTYLPLCLIGGMIYSLLDNMGRKKPVLAGGYCIAIALGFWLNTHPIKIRWFALEDISFEFVYMMMGMALAKWIVRQKRIKGNIFLSIMCILIAGALFGLLHSNQYVDFLISVLMIAAVISISFILAGTAGGERIMKIGNDAFTVYLYSWPIQAVVEIMMTVVLKAGWGITFLVMLFSGLAVPLAMLYIYRRMMPANKYMDAVLGINRKRD